jgi:hypothetical protein
VAPRMDGPEFGDDVATLTAFPPVALAPAPQPDQPVFTDETGRRAEVLQWGGRGFCLMGAVLCAALAVTLQTHVFLPSLEKAFLGSSEGLRPAAGIADTPISGVAPRTELRGESGRTGVAGQRVQLSELTPESATTATRQVGETPITDQRAQRATGTSATAGSDTQPVAGTSTANASAPTTGPGHGFTRAGAVHESGASKAKASAAAKTHEPSAVSKIGNPHAAPKIRNPRATTPASGRQAHPTHWQRSSGSRTPYRSCRVVRQIPHDSRALAYDACWHDRHNRRTA